MNGYAEKNLHVHLAREQSMEAPFPEVWQRAYIGG